MENFPVRRSPAEWALQWLWDQPEVSLILSGMSTMAQVDENLQSADRARVHSFTAEEQALIAAVREKYRARTAIPCTRCGYCMPCPNGVNIPGNFEYFNYAHLFENLPDAHFKYVTFLAEAERSSACIACGVCEEKCPQKIEISQWMPKVTALLA
jgi:predicted aldo/keto reductase-like oxidoreductase